MTRRHALLVAACILVAFAIPSAARAQTAAPSGEPPAQPPPVEPPAGQPTPTDDRDSIEAGKKWLDLIDSNKAGTAWDASSKQLKAAVKRDKFVAELRNARKPYGKLATRTPVKFARAHEMPGAPEGDYAIIEYDAKFANGKRLTEQLVWTLEDGNTWRVASYYYR